MVNSSSSLVRMSRDTTRPPQRASANITTRKVNEIASSQHDRPEVGLAADHDGDDREVDRDEDVFDDGDAEDDGVSRLASRRSSISSFVTIALDEVAVIPAMMSASRVPQPTHMPKAKPTPMLISDAGAAGEQQRAGVAEELVLVELEAEVEQQQDQPEDRDRARRRPPRS